MIVVAGLVLAFILILVFSNPSTRACRWRLDRQAGDEGGVLYRCMACGATVRQPTEVPPRICRKDR